MKKKHTIAWLSRHIYLGDPYRKEFETKIYMGIVDELRKAPLNEESKYKKYIKYLQLDDRRN